MDALQIAPPRTGWFARATRTVGDYRQYLRWKLTGQARSTPFLVKQFSIQRIARARQLSTFIESGTFCGDMAHALRRDFSRIHSIELSRFFAESARRRFANAPHIAIHHGDSAGILPQLLSQQADPCLVWLDGHYASGKIARGMRNMPVLHELELVFSARCSSHVVLLDDAHCFNGQHDYPVLRDVMSLGAAYGRTDVTVADNIITIAPPAVAKPVLPLRKTA